MLNGDKYETFPDFMENLDRQGDCHFFSDENPACNKGPMDRSDIGLNQMITTLNDHEMSFVLDNKANSFDGYACGIPIPMLTYHKNTIR